MPHERFGHVPGTRGTPARWWVRSLSVVAKPGELDLRRQQDALALEGTLAELDLNRLTGV
jgi:hypothetical protein